MFRGIRNDPEHHVEEWPKATLFVCSNFGAKRNLLCTPVIFVTMCFRKAGWSNVYSIAVSFKIIISTTEIFEVLSEYYFARRFHFNDDKGVLRKGVFVSVVVDIYT